MTRTFIAAAVAGLFALPLAAPASAVNDNIVLAQSGGGGGADGPDLANRQPGTASSQPGSMSSEKSASGASGSGFDRLDRNRDGYVSRDEAKDAAELNTRFSELDKNNDGKLSREEYEALNAEAKRGSSGMGATGSGRMGGSGAATPGASPAPGKGGGDASTTGANTK